MFFGIVKWSVVEFINQKKKKVSDQMYQILLWNIQKKILYKRRELMLKD